MAPEEGAATAGQKSNRPLSTIGPNASTSGSIPSKDDPTLIEKIIDQRFNDSTSLSLLAKILDQFDQRHKQRDDNKANRATHKDN